MKATFVLDVLLPADHRKGRQLPASLFGPCEIPILGVRRACLAMAGLAFVWMIFCSDSRAWSATLTWSSTAAGTSWSDASNWGGTLPGSADIGFFSAASYTSQPALTSTASVGGIWDTGSGSITIGGSSALTLFGTAINSNTGTGIEVDAGAGPLTINAPLVLQNNQQWINNSASALTVNGGISGSGSLTILGSGMLTLTGMNTYSGNTTVDGGTLQMPSGSLASPTQYVGYSGSGALLQSGGVNALSGTAGQLYLAYSSSSSGTYNLSGNGLLSAPSEIIGCSGTGSFTQSGGTNTVSGSLVLCQSASSAGTYNLNGGLLALSAGGLTQGSGTATFNFGGGTLGAVTPWSSSLNMNMSGSGSRIDRA